MAKQIVWTKTAQKARTAILEFWIEHNKSKRYLRKLAKQFRTRVNYLSKNNYLGKPTDLKDVMVTFVSHFSLFYKINDDKLIIVGIWDNRRNPDDLIENLEV